MQVLNGAVAANAESSQRLRIVTAFVRYGLEEVAAANKFFCTTGSSSFQLAETEYRRELQVLWQAGQRKISLAITKANGRFQVLGHQWLHLFGEAIKYVFHYY